MEKWKEMKKKRKRRRANRWEWHDGHAAAITDIVTISSKLMKSS